MKSFTRGARRPRTIQLLTAALAVAACMAIPSSAFAVTSGSVNISAGPAEGSATNAVSIQFDFAYSGADALNSIQCQIDGGGYSPCTSAPISYPSLGEGAHTFDVYASVTTMAIIMNCLPAPPGPDICTPMPMPMPDVTPVTTRTFTIDRTAPSLSLAGGPSNGATAPVGPVSFTFNVEAGSTISCSLDSAAAVDCTPGFVTPALEAGSHTLSATASDSAGNTATLSESFTVAAASVPAAPAPTPAKRRVCKKVKVKKHGKYVRTKSGKIKRKRVCKLV